MSLITWRRAAGALILGAAVAILGAGSAAAQDPLQQILQRLEKLEKENADLKQKLDGRPAPYQPPDPGKEQVNKAVDDYLKKKDDRKKADEKKAQEKKESEGYEVGKQLDFKGKWLHGLWFETEDKAFRVHVGGRTQIDAAFVHAPQNVMGPVGNTPGIGEFDDAVNFRRARLAIEGTFWEVFDFNCEYDFLNAFRFVPGGNVLGGRAVGGAPIAPANLNNLAGTIPDRRNIANTPVPTDLWIAWTKIPYVQTVRVGNHKPWLAFEHATSSRFLDFLERSYAFDAFVENGNNGFAPGVSVVQTHADKRFNFAAGVFKANTVDIFGYNVGDGEYQFSSRVWGTPYYSDNGRCMLHCGVSYNHRGADDGIVRYRARTLIRNGSAVHHNTVAIIQAQAHDENIIVPEVALNYGPFNLSAEYYAVWANQRPGEVFQNVANQTASLPGGGRGSLYYQGGYVTAGYFLTGEHRTYNQVNGSWDRQAVNEGAFFVDGDEGFCFGRGAWEVLARYSWLDLDDKGVNGGIINSGTIGVNWFLNPNAKIQFNYELAYRNVTAYTTVGTGAAATLLAGPAQQGNFDGIYQAFGTRFAFDF